MLLLSRWYEMFSTSCPDSYLPRLTNAPSLADELSAVVDRARSSAKAKSHWSSHIDAVFQELQHVVREDPAVDAHSSELGVALSSFQSTEDLDSRARICKLMRGALGTYGSDLESRLTDAVSGLPKEKRECLDLVSRIGTLALRNRLDEMTARSYANEYEASLDVSELAPRLLSWATPSNERWKCVFGLAGDIPTIRSFLSATEFEQGRSGMFPATEEGRAVRREWSELKLKPVALAVRAPSAIAALENSVRPLRTAIDAVSLYNNRIIVRIHPMVCVWNDSHTRTLNLDEISSPRLKPRIRAKSEVLELLRAVDVHSNSLRGAEYALEHHRLALSGRDPRLRVVHLWSALEALSPIQGQPSLERVKAAVIPAILHRRTDKLVRYLAILLHKYGVGGARSLDQHLFPRTDERRVDPVELLAALTGGTIQSGPSARLETLAHTVAEHPHLLQRLHELWAMLRSPKQLRQSLMAAETRISWQLARIQRVRNLTLHYGEHSEHAAYLANNLHYYFSVSLSRALHDLRRNADWTVPDALQSRALRYQRLMIALHEHAGSIRASDLLAEPTKHALQLTVWPSG